MNAMMWKPPTMTDPNEEDAADRPHRELRIGGAIVALFFLGLLGWAAQTPLDAGAYAQGVIAVSGNRQAVQRRLPALRLASGDVRGRPRAFAAETC